MQTTTQVWIRVLNHLLEFRKPQNLPNIAMGVGLPIKIDPLTLSLYHGLFARILIELDLAKPLARRVLVTKKDQDSCNEMEFFAEIELENLPKYCEQCRFIGHDAGSCRKDTNLINDHRKPEQLYGWQNLQQQKWHATVEPGR